MTINFHQVFISLAAIAASTLSMTSRADDPEVYKLGGFFDEPTDSTLVSDISETIAVESYADADTTPAFDFYEALRVEQERLNQPLIIDRTIDVSYLTMPDFFYLPSVYKPYRVGRYVSDTIPMPQAAPRGIRFDRAEWLDRAIARHDAMDAALQQFNASYPWVVRLNIDSLPEPPKKYEVTVDPATTEITIKEIKIDLAEANKEIAPIELKRKNWLHTFKGSLQFSQAYNSPNWYQGGNNNVNLIANFRWDVKLNPKFYPKVLFENTVQYKLAVNSAPDDTLRSYSISEDLFQVNTKFGLKATNNWYYSVNMQFKTQLLQNHPTNSRSLTAAFLSPGELNFGLGMTYNTTTPNKKVSFNISLDPLSYNMICYANTRVTAYTDKKVLNQYGSKLEAKMTWKPTYNISYTTRLYAFTNYEYVQGDWEHTVSFDINRFLSTQIYVHLRYDSSTLPTEGTKWHRWQLKEILSFGFAYSFSSL